MAKDRHKTEEDVDDDPAVAGSRATDGVTNPAHPDQASTTGTTPKGTYVGRVAGNDVGYEGETGAEARTAAERDRQDPPEHRSSRRQGGQRNRRR